MARLLLEGASVNDHSIQTQPVNTDASMIDAKQAATALRLPYYWFADHNMRTKYRIPHYLLGGLVRYRLSELIAWAANAREPQNREVHQAKTPAEEDE